MHPGFIGWWKHGRRGGDCREDGPFADPREHLRDWAEAAGFGHFHGGPGGRHGHGPHGHHGGPPDFDGDGGGFGVRRPLRFLAWKLELEEEQVGKLAAILDELKTERAQAAVDNRRTIGGLADAVAGSTFEESKAKDSAELRVKSAERVRDALVTALGKIHAMLDDEQRKKLAYLLRTGVLTV